MRHITEHEVRRLLPMRKAIDLLAAAFEDPQSENQPRRRLHIPGGATLHSMAGATAGYFGTKVYSTHPGYSPSFHVLLYESATAKPVALIEANWLGQIRTGAASGLATDWLAKKRATTAALLGAGFQARSQLEALLAVRQLMTVRIWSRDFTKAEKLAAEFDVIAVRTVDEAIDGAEIISTATGAKDPLFHTKLAPGTHINAMGSNYKNRREIPAEVVRQADLIVADNIEAAKIEAGDLLLAMDDWSHVKELRDQPRRQNDEQITLFKSVGLGLEDVAVAAYCYHAV